MRLAPLLHKRQAEMAITRDDELSNDYAELVILLASLLHANIAHRSGGRPHTLEAVIVRVADALDMSEGRSRIPYEAGKVDIHSISAASIDRVEILEGEPKPAQINVWINSMAGVFQVDELLTRKLIGSAIVRYVKVSAFIKNDAEPKLVKEVQTE